MQYIKNKRYQEICRNLAAKHLLSLESFGSLTEAKESTKHGLQEHKLITIQSL